MSIDLLVFLEYSPLVGNVFFFFLWIRRPPRSPLFPSTPLFRSVRATEVGPPHPGCRGTCRRAEIRTGFDTLGEWSRRSRQSLRSKRRRLRSRRYRRRRRLPLSSGLRRPRRSVGVRCVSSSWSGSALSRCCVWAGSRRHSSCTTRQQSPTSVRLLLSPAST